MHSNYQKSFKILVTINNTPLRLNRLYMTNVAYRFTYPIRECVFADNQNSTPF